ncbi:MAG: tetratricopeptide repeat protein [Aquirhabdus sp.]
MLNPKSLPTPTMPASIYLLKAQQAQTQNQWEHVCTYAKACMTTAQHDEKMRNDAKELLAIGLTNLNQREQALPLWLELHQTTPNDPNILGRLGEVLVRLKRYDDAIKCFQRALQLAPEHIMFYMFMALAYFEKGDFTQARLSYQTASNLAPQYLLAKYGVARMFEAEELIEDAITAYEQVLLLEPTHLAALGNLIFLNHSRYPFDMSRHTLLLSQFGNALNQETPTNPTTKLQFQPHKPLRVGFVSADLCRHVVSRFLESTLEQLNKASSLRQQLTLVAYANQATHDEYTTRLQSQFDLWHVVYGWGDERLTNQIKQDNIDILIDLSGHTQGNRLPIFAKKAAPLQVSWLGYWGSTGLSSIDYILADPVCVPVGEEHLYFEKVWRLPYLRYCFSPLEDAPAVSALPCLKNPHFVFGCYQKITKINDGVLAHWAKILAACPHARLRIQSLNFSNSAQKNQFIKRMQLANLNTQQVDLVGGMSTQDYLASYAEVDILLDTFPYTGGTTTIEALWMGVPTLTLAMQGMLGRQGEALMVNAGLPDWVAHSEEDYVQKAIHWANSSESARRQLATLRAEVREQIRLSPVFNATQFAQDFVDAIYGMWQEKYKIHSNIESEKMS